VNPRLSQLHPYPFEKLATLFQGIDPNPLPPIAFSIGEPQHAAPDFVQNTLREHTSLLRKYPTVKGIPELREAIANWLSVRFTARVDAETQILPVNGTREALFAIAQAIVDPTKRPLVLMPNPFYQIYEGAALLAGAEPHYLPCLADNHFKPDFKAVPAAVWQRCQLIYLCSPGNPTGAVSSLDELQQLIRLADEHDFIIASDECYSEIYDAVPPVGLLEACSKMGRKDFARCMVFHSLSKRSNLPGLRSGFVAGDATLMREFLRYRTYQGGAMPVHHQMASIAAWQDEAHVETNRAHYREKFAAVLEILKPVMSVQAPDAGFYLWPETPIDDTLFVRDLKQQQNLTVLPGSYLSRLTDGIDPGKNRVRMALVAPLDECIEGARRLRRFVEQLP
jgi:N-succinyldiaminopimelate aminotransferase